MTLNLNTIISAVGLIASIIALYFSSKKNDSEVDNIDADTISILYDTISKQDKYYKDCRKEQDACYQQLKKEFESYKEAMNTQMEYLQKETLRWRTWAEKLSKQLKDNGIQPEPF